MTVNKICDAYSAQIISNTIPIQMEAGKSYQVSLTVKNTGSRSWTEANAYRLGALGDSNLFAATRQYLSSNEAIAYGQTKTFSIIMTAPSTGGTYATNWRMVRDGYSWFGDTLSKSIKVVAVNLGLNSNGEEYLDNLVAESGATRTADTVTLNGITVTFDNSNSRILNGRRVVNVYYFANTFTDEIVLQNRLFSLSDFYNSTPDTAICTVPTGGELNTTAVADVSIETAPFETAGENIRKIQIVLQRAGYWVNPDGTASNASATGYFGTVTKASLIKFQKQSMLLSDSDLYNSNGAYCGCGPATAAKLSTLYNQYFGSSSGTGNTIVSQPMPTIIVGNTVIQDVTRRRDGSIWANFSQMALEGYSAGGATNIYGRLGIDDEITIECWHEDNAQMVEHTYSESEFITNVQGRYLYWVIQMAKDLGYGNKIYIYNKSDGSQLIYIDCNRKLSDFEIWMNQHVFTPENIDTLNAINFATIALGPEIYAFDQFLILSASMQTSNKLAIAEVLSRQLGKSVPEVIEALDTGSVAALTMLDALEYVPVAYRTQVFRAFQNGTMEAETLIQELIVYRHWGDGALETGSPWFSTTVYSAEEARKLLALPEVNSAVNVTEFKIKAGTTILKGKVSSMVGEEYFGNYAVGGGTQIYTPIISNATVVGRVR